MANTNNSREISNKNLKSNQEDTIFNDRKEEFSPKEFVENDDDDDPNLVEEEEPPYQEDQEEDEIEPQQESGEKEPEGEIVQSDGSINIKEQSDDGVGLKENFSLR